MKKQDVIVLANLGVANATNHTLSVEHAYKVVKFRKALQSTLEAIGKDEEAIRKDAGIEDAQAFDKELAELRENKKRTKEQQKKLDEMEAKLKRFVELRGEMFKEEVDLGCKALPYAEWHKLQNENKEVEINGRKVDLLSGYAEDLLEGVLWEAPKEEE